VIAKELVEGKVALVTGASRGIGAGLAEEFVRAGMKLVLCSRSQPAMDEGESVIARSVDVRDESEMESLVADAQRRFGAIDLWINNAGVLDPVAPVRDTEVAAFREHIDINLVGVFIGTRCYVRHLRRHDRGGVLINLSSGAAWNAYEGWGAYCAGKAGVERLTEVVAKEEADAGLRAYSIAPGVVDTAMQEAVRGTDPEIFPDLDYFLGLKRDDGFNTVPFIAEHFLRIAFDPAQRPDAVALRLPREKEA
jgi:NAD(P)-dependent dehydrogenase (short-subunit alcohol dehydrogenase family)